MTLQTILDTREQHLAAALRSEQLSAECGSLVFTTEQLTIGDIVYRYNDLPVCLIERKEIKDYAASIKDKRSRNQSIRMKQLKKENPDIIIIYIVEGPFLSRNQKFGGGVTRDVLYSSMINKIVRDDFTVYHTADIYDTALIVAKIHSKLLEHKRFGRAGAEGIESERIEYLKTIQLAKKDNMTPDNCYVCQLAQIPGVSIDMANIIASQPAFNTMQKLILAYSQQPANASQCAELLSEIPLPIANNKTRRLGSVVSKRIYQFLCPEPLVPVPVKPKLQIVRKSLATANI